MHLEGTSREGGATSNPSSCPSLQRARGDGVLLFGYLAFRGRRVCSSVLPRSELLVQLVSFSSRHTWVPHPITQW